MLSHSSCQAISEHVQKVFCFWGSSDESVLQNGMLDQSVSQADPVVVVLRESTAERIEGREHQQLTDKIAAVKNDKWKMVRSSGIFAA